MRAEPGARTGAIQRGRRPLETSEAIELIRDGIPAGAGTWADFGAGQGVFTRALAALLGPQGRVFAVERDPTALRALRVREPAEEQAEVVPVDGDFRSLDSIRELAGVQLDGALFANSLHFAPDADLVLVRAARCLRPGGRIVVIEYDGREPSRWVPYPIARSRLAVLASRAGLEAPEVLGERPSAYGGTLYAAVCRRPE